MEKNSKQPKSFYESPEGANYLTSLYRDRGLTDQQVADEIGYTRQTLYNWKKESKIIRDSINIGKDYIDTNVENALLKSALQGNVTAMIFWLKNRKPKKWRDSFQQEITANLDIKEAADKYRKYLDGEISDDS